MKKIIILTFLVSVSIQLFGQNVRFSFLANPQFSWLSSNKEIMNGEGVVVGLNTGIEMDIFFAEKYAFSTGLTINNKGGKISYDEEISFKTSDERVTVPAGNEITKRYQYLSIPLGLKFKTLEIGYNTYWIDAGITPMVNIKSRATDEEEILSKSNLIDETSIFNINYFIEAGIEYSLGGNTAIIAGAGFYSGFLDITKADNAKISSNSVSLKVGILF